jgi:hypothetical protein
VTGPDRAVIAAVDRLRLHAQLAGVDLTTGRVVWSHPEPLTIRPQHFDPEMTNCGPLACYTDGAGVLAIDPADGSTTLEATGAAAVLDTPAGLVVEYGLANPGPGEAGEETAWVDPATGELGPKISGLRPVAGLASPSRLIGLLYVAHNGPVSSGDTTLLVSATTSAAITTLAQLPGANWQCSGAGTTVACVDASTTTVRMWSLN